MSSHSHQRIQHSGGRVGDGSMTNSAGLLSSRPNVDTGNVPAPRISSATTTTTTIEREQHEPMTNPLYTPAFQRASALQASSVTALRPPPQEPLSLTEVSQRTCDPRLMSTRIRRLKTEYEYMTTDPPPNCSASPKGDDLNEWVASIQGPENTVYEGGTFFLDIIFPKDFPYVPPKIRFITRIYHCNINSQGVICLDILKTNWSPALTVSKILLSLSSLLCDCNPDDPLVGSVAKLYISDRAEHDKNAKQWTQKYAT